MVTDDPIVHHIVRGMPLHSDTGACARAQLRHSRDPSLSVTEPWCNTTTPSWRSDPDGIWKPRSAMLASGARLGSAPPRLCTRPASYSTIHGGLLSPLSPASDS